MPDIVPYIIPTVRPPVVAKPPTVSPPPTMGVAASATQTTKAIVSLIKREVVQRASRAPSMTLTSGWGRRDTAEEDSAGYIVGSTKPVDASSCVVQTEIDYVPPTPPTPPTP